MFKAIVLPNPRQDRFSTKNDFFHEFTNAEIDKLDLIGLPIWFNHDENRKYKDVGKVTDQWRNSDGDLGCTFHLNRSGGARALLQLMKDTDKYKEVSLQHKTRLTNAQNGTIQYTKTPVEISVCKKGRRNTPIIEMNPVAHDWQHHLDRASKHFAEPLSFRSDEHDLFTPEAIAQSWTSVRGIKSIATASAAFSVDDDASSLDESQNKRQKMTLSLCTQQQPQQPTISLKMPIPILSSSSKVDDNKKTLFLKH